MTLSGFRAQNHPQQTGKRGAADKVDDRRTPDAIYLPLYQRWRFNLDVAASRENAKTLDFYTRVEDGLVQSWLARRVWCNPPYSDCGAWVAKAHLEALVSPLIVMLLPANRTEQRWWQELVEPHRDNGGVLTTRFLAGRPRFEVPDGTYTDPRGNRPPFGCVLLTWRNEDVPWTLPAGAAQ